MKHGIFLIVTLIFSLSVTAQLKIQNGAILSLKGNAHITLADVDLENDGSILTEANSRFIFTGNANSNLAGTQPTQFNEIEIAKSGMNFLAIRTSAMVSGKIIFTSGLIELNDNNINLGSAAFLQNEQESSRITGENGGRVIYTTNLNSPNAVNPGNLGAVITTTKNLGSVTIMRGHESQNNGAGLGSSIFRYYDILPANNTSLDATLRFHYFDAELNNLNENGLVLWKSPDNFTWTDQGLSSRNTIANYVEKNRIEDFSRWTLSTTVALPVTGLQLSGRWKNNASDLTWITFAEYSNDHFEIERKYPDENDFSQIGSKNSAHIDGNAQRPTSYGWTDATVSPNRGILQYRLRQVDRNGQFSYSNTIVVKPASSYVFIEKIFPTSIVESNLYIQTGNSDCKEMQVRVYDMLGRLHLDKKLEYRSLWLPLISLSNGMYKIIIRSGAESYTNSFIKQ